MYFLVWYMTVEASHGEQNSCAALQSPAMKEASNECLLEFYCHVWRGVSDYSDDCSDGTDEELCGHYITPAHDLGEIQTAQITSSTLLPSTYFTVKLYHYSHGENSTAARLVIILRTLRNGDDDRILWDKTVTQSFLWHRAEVTFSTSVKSKENEFHCWQSDGLTCIAAGAQCNYILDCPLGEDEETRGPCSFKNGQCQWSDISVGPNKWQWVKASNNTDLPTDHTTGTGHYMQMYIMDPSQNEAVFQSPSLPITSACCQLLLHFHMGAGSAGNLSMILQKGEEDRKLLWSRSISTSTQWVPEHLPLGKQDQPYRIIFSCQTWLRQDDYLSATRTMALDDIAFHNCYYLYMDSSVGTWGDTALILSEIFTPDSRGHCFTFWYHMSGQNFGTLRLYINNRYRTMTKNMRTWITIAYKLQTWWFDY
ncbi:hypothetical protein cypCar_00023854 [Cyprinus carpio]|nr:hypothetical protein cypCar_00023854 [Cyprinus carpio]